MQQLALLIGKDSTGKFYTHRGKDKCSYYSTEQQKVVQTSTICYPKPWSKSIAHIAPRDTPNRVDKVRQSSEAMNQLLCETPYVEFSWSDGTFKERSLA